MPLNEDLYILNLTEGFEPLHYNEKTPNYMSFTKSQFPGGERNIKINGNAIRSFEKVCITCRIKSSNDIMDILLAHDSLKRIGFKQIFLFIPYVPYARQDRVCNPGEAFSLKVFADLINSKGFDRVYMMDAHSDVTPAVINNSYNYNNYELIGSLRRYMGYDHFNKLILISPDSGANKKANALARRFNLNLVKGDKVRDLSTGAISGFQVFTDDLNNADCIIVDDICDGGGTFLGLAEELKAKNAGRIYLAVTHGIFSKGLEIFENSPIDHIFCTNSFSSKEASNLTILKISHLIL
jgi:ribose-phosphate pyrophosphokinase